MSKELTPGEATHWKTTILWAYLQKSVAAECPAVRTTLESCMPVIQKILAQGATAPKDFTLHDAGHGFRVAQRMADIIPDEVLSQLTAYELALLLLSAYLHDIGMTPEQKKLTAHYNYLLTGVPEGLIEQEVKDFQRWMDDEGYDIEPPISEGRPTGDVLRLAEEVTAYYCRHRHNDWGAEWVRANLEGKPLGTYANWVTDLIDLCRSHHYDYDELKRPKFDPRYVGEPPAMVHLRYLACALRVADVLEVDPERTPEVIFRHRDVSEGSVIYWYKDHHLSVKLSEGEEPNIIVSARPSKAYIHRALDITVDQINEELRTCRAIADETHFEKYLTESLPHRWVLPRSVHRAINPADGTYEYINGAFRPDTRKLLELLSGVELYGTPLAAVRELLQNAFDAVREQIAHERLRKDDPADPKWERALGGLHTVKLRLESDNDGAWLVCEDTGVGMTKAIINDHLLVSGVARRHEVLELERRARKHNFTVGRTGQFGIGVLSYFMLADRTVIRTRRSLEAGSTEGNGWRFETRGVGSFGELRQDAELMTGGTEVRLRLRLEVVGNSLTDWYASLRAYLKETLLRVPCEFQLTSPLPGCEALRLEPGWVLPDEDWTDLLLEPLRAMTRMTLHSDLQVELLPRATREKMEASQRNWQQVLAEAGEPLEWREHRGSLPDGLGEFRFLLPYFKLPGGSSLAFLRVLERGAEIFLKSTGYRQFFFPKGRRVIGWKGMAANATSYLSEEEKRYGLEYFFESGDLKFTPLEVDFTSPDAAKISVSRNELVLSAKAKAAMDWLNNHVNEIRLAFLQEHKDSAYAALNAKAVEGALLPARLSWLVESDESGADEAEGLDSWKALEFPVVSEPRFENWRRAKLSWEGRAVTVAPRLNPLDSNLDFYDITFNPHSAVPDRVVMYRRPVKDTPLLLGLWSQPSGGPQAAHAAGPVCRFPPTWRSLLGVTFPSYSDSKSGKRIWNQDHPIISAVDAAGAEWAKSVFRNSHDPLPYKDELLRHRNYLASWVIHSATRGGKDLWNGVRDREPLFLPRAWELLFGAGPGADDFAWFTSAELGGFAFVLTPERWWEPRWEEIKDKYLPDPGPEWSLLETVDEGDASARDEGRSREGAA